MKKTIGTLSLALATLVLSASIALAALTVDAAKQQGMIGEQPDGLLGLVISSPDEEAQTLVKSTNDERILRYQAIAAKNGSDIEDVKALAGQKLISGTSPGQYFMNAAGVWQKK